MDSFEPELGQAAFGQPYGPHRCPAILRAALDLISKRLEYLVESVLPYETREQWGNPFSNSGNTFTCPAFEVAAYSWDEEVKQEWNFRCGEIRVSWYKHSNRSPSCPEEYSPDQVAAMLDRCLVYIDKADALIDDDLGRELSEEGRAVKEALAKDDGWHVTVPDVPGLREDPAQPAACRNLEDSMQGYDSFATMPMLGLDLAMKTVESQSRAEYLETENKSLREEVERLRGENERFRSLFGENGKGYLTVRDLCFTAFMRAKDVNDEDGGPTDWFTDTLPAVEKGIDKMLGYAAKQD